MATWLQSILKFNIDPALVDRRQFERWVHHWLHHSDLKVRYASAACASEIKSDSIKAALMKRIADTNEHPLVRGQCLESLSSHLGWAFAKDRLDRQALKLVLRCLKDSDANVRFWACYVCGQRRIGSAFGKLSCLTRDPAIAEMGWTVGYEAGEALKSIRGESAWEDWPPQQLPSPYTPL